MNVLVKVKSYSARPKYLVAVGKNKDVDMEGFNECQRNGLPNSIMFYNAIGMKEAANAVEMVVGCTAADFTAGVIVVDEVTGKLPETYEDIRFDLESGELTDLRRKSRPKR